MAESVQLPAIGSGDGVGAAPAASSTRSNAPDVMVKPERADDSRTPLECPHAARIASHQGVLENAHRGRGERRDDQVRESTRERSRRIDRPSRRDDRAGKAAETEPKKARRDDAAEVALNSNKGEDELMEAAGPTVYDLTQQDAVDSDSEGNLTKLPGSGLGPYKVFNSASGDGIVAPTPGLAPAPTTPLAQLAQHGPAPPWISDLLDSMATLHQKQDRTHVDVLEFGNEIKNQGLRLDTLELGVKEHTQLHESAKHRLDELERQVRDLRNQPSRSPTPSRGPQTPRRGTSNLPRSPRSPHFAYDEQRPDTDDLQIVIGGWTDARKPEAFEEVKHMLSLLSNVGHPDCVSELWAPASRTNFVRLTLAFPDGNAHISVLRTCQNTIIAALKTKAFKNGIQGQNGCKLWATKNKNPEERARVRACVLTKVFFESLPDHQGHKVSPPEIVWQGRVFLDHVQVLHHIDKKDPVAGDCFLPDNRGNHMEWFISASAFSAATGRPSETLQECYNQYGSSSTREN